MSLRSLYEEYGLDETDLSRAVEAAGTPTGPLFPWHAGAVYMAGVLQFSTSWEFVPFYFFGFLSPLVLFAMALSGHGYDQTRDQAGAPAVADD